MLLLSSSSAPIHLLLLSSSFAPFHLVSLIISQKITFFFLAQKCDQVGLVQL